MPSAGSSILYDNAGNLTRDFQGHSYGFDAENHQTSYDNGAASYAYDPKGRRVKKIIGTITTIRIYDIRGQVVAEYSATSALLAHLKQAGQLRERTMFLLGGGVSQ
jgi:hypothetical protein